MIDTTTYNPVLYQKIESYAQFLENMTTSEHDLYYVDPISQQEYRLAPLFIRQLCNTLGVTSKGLAKGLVLNRSSFLEYVRQQDTVLRPQSLDLKYRLDTSKQTITGFGSCLQVDNPLGIKDCIEDLAHGDLDGEHYYLSYSKNLCLYYNEYDESVKIFLYSRELHGLMLLGKQGRGKTTLKAHPTVKLHADTFENISKTYKDLVQHAFAWLPGVYLSLYEVRKLDRFFFNLAKHYIISDQELRVISSLLGTDELLANYSDYSISNTVAQSIETKVDSFKFLEGVAMALKNVEIPFEYQLKIGFLLGQLFIVDQPILSGKIMTSRPDSFLNKLLLKDNGE